MGDGHWSDTAGHPEGEYYGEPGEGCWYRKKGGPSFWVTGGVHELYGRLGYEGGLLGMPVSNFDPETGTQRFEHGVIYWDGDKFSSGALDQDVEAETFPMPAVPRPPE